MRLIPVGIGVVDRKAKRHVPHAFHEDAMIGVGQIRAVCGLRDGVMKGEVSLHRGQGIRAIQGAFIVGLSALNRMKNSAWSVVPLRTA